MYVRFLSASQCPAKAGSSSRDRDSRLPVEVDGNQIINSERRRRLHFPTEKQVLPPRTTKPLAHTPVQPFAHSWKVLKIALACGGIRWRPAV